MRRSLSHVQEDETENDVGRNVAICPPALSAGDECLTITGKLEAEWFSAGAVVHRGRHGLGAQRAEVGPGRVGHQ